MKIINQFLKEARSFEKKDSAKAIIKCPHGKVLIIRRQMTGCGGEGHWDIPGGCIEKGENEVDALKREAFEEVGLSIDGVKKLKTVTIKIPEKGINSKMHIYTATSEGMDVKLKPATWEGSNNKPEHIEYKWIELKIDLENLPMIKELKDVVMSQLK